VGPEPSVKVGEWNHWTVSFDRGNNEVRGYKNGSLVGTVTAGPIGNNPNHDDHIGNNHTDFSFLNGTVDEVRMYNRALTDAEVSELYNEVAAQGDLTTATKSFASPVKPDLSDLVYSLNGSGGSITIDAIGSPGTASEEVVSQTLGGASSYSLTWSSSHTDFRVRPQLDHSDITKTPTISSIGLTA